MTTQQICDRLAEEAGWKLVLPNATQLWEPYWGHATLRPRSSHPFPPDSIDAAVRGVPEGWAWQVGCSQAGFDAWLCNPNPLTEYVGRSNESVAHALYFTIAKARGWM